MKVHINSLRLLFLCLSVAGCAQSRVMHVTGPYPDSPTVRRCLEYWTSNFSTNAINHFYVGKVKPRGGFTDAFVYWKEERTILEYNGLDPDAPKGAEIFAWQGGELKLDRDTVDTPEDIAGSTYLITHHTWMDWMEGCISHGREYVIPLEEAKKLCPKEKGPDDP